MMWPGVCYTVYASVSLSVPSRHSHFAHRASGSNVSAQHIITIIMSAVTVICKRFFFPPRTHAHYASFYSNAGSLVCAKNKKSKSHEPNVYLNLVTHRAEAELRERKNHIMKTDHTVQCSHCDGQWRFSSFSHFDFIGRIATIRLNDVPFMSTRKWNAVIVIPSASTLRLLPIKYAHYCLPNSIECSDPMGTG